MYKKAASLNIETLCLLIFEFKDVDFQNDLPKTTTGGMPAIFSA